MEYKSKGELAYQLRLSGNTWEEIKNNLNSSGAIHIARKYANKNNLTWPIVLSERQSEKIKNKYNKPGPKGFDLDSLL